VRIDRSPNSDQISLKNPQMQLLPQLELRSQTGIALDSYSRSTESATIIDAEYVEVFSGSRIALPSKPSSIYRDFGIVEVNVNSGGQQGIPRQNPVSRYQEMAAEATVPGKYVDVYA
jgi:hypothetical protein